MVIRLRLSVYGKECTPLLEEEAYREIDECDIEEFGTLGISEKTIAMLGDRWWPQAAKQEGGNLAKRFYVIYGSNAMSAQMLEVSLLGVGTMLRFERDAWPMVK